MTPEKNSTFIRNTVLQHGFSFCGFSKSEYLAEEEPRLTNWLKENKHGEMKYMENYFDKRLDPRILVPGSKSVISMLYNYYTDQKQEDPEAPKISKYALGEDYHHVIKNKLETVLATLRKELGNFDARIFVDSAPVMDKVWAKKSGLGWIGKNSNLINKTQGSFFFIAEIICDLDLKYDDEIKDFCGTCTACIDACPTEAIAEPYVVDGSKCISYFTIELKDSVLPKEQKNKFENWMFGCDICQDVCPWNRFSKIHHEPLFIAKPEVLNTKKEEWEALNEKLFNEFFRRSAVKRTKFEGLKRNIRFLTS